MTAQISEYGTSGPMAGDENSGGNSNNNDGGSDESFAVVEAAAVAAAERVVMIALKMEGDDEDPAAGTSSERQLDDPERNDMVQSQSPLPDGHIGKTYDLFSSTRDVSYGPPISYW